MGNATLDSYVDGDGRALWTYDAFARFPFMRGAEACDDEVMIGSDHPDGGTCGEFGVRGYALDGRGSSSARLEGCDDAWHVFARSGVGEFSQRTTTPAPAGRSPRSS